MAYTALGRRDGKLAAAFNQRRALEIIQAYALVEGAALPVLHALQAEFGCVPADTVPLVADALNLSRAEVHGIVSFYHDFRTAPPGRHVLKLCRAEACQSMGGDALAAEAQSALQTGWGGTSADGAITLEPVFCLGLCACAPAAMLDGEVVGALDGAKLGRLLDQVRRP